MAWPCFLVEPTGHTHLQVGVFGKAQCPALPVGQNCVARAIAGEIAGDEQVRAPPPDDPSWPTKCDHCSRAFGERTRWAGSLPLYRGPDGKEFYLRDAKVGALWRAPWLEDCEEWRGPDGRSFVVMLPGRIEWCIDGPATGGGKWTRTGEPPKLTASPSILVPGYHGFLRDGVLTDPC